MYINFVIKSYSCIHYNMFLIKLIFGIILSEVTIFLDYYKSNFIFFNKSVYFLLLKLYNTF